MSNNCDSEYFNLFFSLMQKLYNPLQEEFVQKTDPASAPLTFSDELKKEVKYLLYGFVCLFDTLVPQRSSQEFTFYISFYV